MTLLPRGTTLEAHAPAKLNLHLELLARRTDGFHELETLLVPVSVYDTLRFTPRTTSEIQLHVRWAESVPEACRTSLPPDSENLVSRALVTFQREANCSLGAAVALIKRIPAQAGLGGASSNAAEALRWANQAWNVNWPLPRLAALAAELGSDVPFFLTRSVAVGRGRGEQLEYLPHLAPLAVVIVRPPEGLATPAVYRACRVPTTATSVQPLVSAWRAGDWAAVGQKLLNRLQEPAASLSSWIERLLAAMAATSCLGSLMSGSGSSCFAICRSWRHALQVAAHLRNQRLGWVTVARAGSGV
jgi:4-diphosphocytidyl-2-C-methyl-D-erythritol kinase